MLQQSCRLLQGYGSTQEIFYCRIILLQDYFSCNKINAAVKENKTFIFNALFISFYRR